MKKAAGALSVDVISSDITISRKIYQQRASTSRGNLELAIAKRCRLHKLIRQRFAFALKIQQMLFALISSSRKIPAGSYIVGKSSRKHLKPTNGQPAASISLPPAGQPDARKEELAKRYIQTQATAHPVVSYNEPAVAMNPVARLIQSKATVLCISSRQRIQQKRKAVVDMNQQRSS
ncbi:DNAJ heat shock N-terminal domain-containing protein isoform 1 [Dorcoceras hygrometricum]|uniref:DNAJ heat shock N-terminal domain-containing protein isoform 1 n=1 Tax=Dorcoceras hygrometricum TaxID=472368 RepID=A0A2Z7APN8_9LAMI|nr:DNAJ heat shock N-terminal domain-containing protein isoform 1 [Dorcoceras hygrometricum]